MTNVVMAKLFIPAPSYHPAYVALISRLEKMELSIGAKSLSSLNKMICNGTKLWIKKLNDKAYV